MKILHISPTYYPAIRYGGPIKSEHELNKWLVKNGVDVTVYTTNIDSFGALNVPINQVINVDGVKVFYFPITFRSWQFSWQLCRALKNNIKNFDLVRITSVFLAASTLGAYYAKKFNKAYIISPRGSLMIEPIKKNRWKKKIYMSLIEKRNLKDAVIHFTAQMEKEEYLRLNFPLKKFIIIPNGFDFEEFNKKVLQGFFRKKFKISSDKKIILFLSRLSWKKGFDTLIPAFAEVVKKWPKAVLIIAGGDDEGYKKEIDKIIDNYNLRLGENVIFTGMLTGEDKIAAYQDGDVFVLPSYSENFGNVVLEAAYFGLPQILTKGVAIAYEFEKVGAAIIINKNVKELSEAILKILENPEIEKKIGLNGKKFVESEFSWDKMAKRFKDEYNTIIKL